MAAKCEISTVSKSYGAHRAVHEVSLSVAEGEFVVILGPSGCGKTTTLRMIAGLDRPSAGQIAIDGAVVSSPDRFVRPEHRAIGMVFQSYAIWPHMTVWENVAYPLRVRGMGARPRRDQAERMLDLVGLAGAGPRPATALSGGQMQRVALARALVADPTLLLFDEPLSNLDLKLRERLRLELKAVQRRTGLTSIYVTHDQAEAVELADRIVVMEAGRIVQEGRPQDLYREPRTRFVAEFIATANILPATVLSATGPGIARIRTQSGFEIEARHDGPATPGATVAVVIHPEDCALHPPGTDGPAVTVTEARYLGTATRYTVALHAAPPPALAPHLPAPDLLTLDVLVLGTDAPLPEGSAATLHVAPGRARLVPA